MRSILLTEHKNSDCSYMRIKWRITSTFSHSSAWQRLVSWHLLISADLEGVSVVSCLESFIAVTIYSVCVVQVSFLSLFLSF